MSMGHFLKQSEKLHGSTYRRFLQNSAMQEDLYSDSLYLFYLSYRLFEFQTIS